MYSMCLSRQVDLSEVGGEGTNTTSRQTERVRLRLRPRMMPANSIRASAPLTNRTDADDTLGASDEHPRLRPFLQSVKSSSVAFRKATYAWKAVAQPSARAAPRFKSHAARPCIALQGSSTKGAPSFGSGLRRLAPSIRVQAPC